MAAKKLRKYELIYIVQPEASEEVKERIISRTLETIEKGEGHLLKKEVWGKRKLAYEIRKHPKGIYYYLVFAAYPGLTPEIERSLRLTDDCLRFMTLKLEDAVSLEQALAEVEQQRERIQAAEAKIQAQAEAAEAAKAEAAKAEAPKAEAAKAEAPKTEAPKTEAPKTEEGSSDA